jgi:hypothetical protein
MVKCPAGKLAGRFHALRRLSMSKRSLDSSRECPVCHQLHHFVYVIEPRPSIVYRFECPVTKKLSEIQASQAAQEGTGPIQDDTAPVVPAVSKLPN